MRYCLISVFSAVGITCFNTGETDKQDKGGSEHPIIGAKIKASITTHFRLSAWSRISGKGKGRTSGRPPSLHLINPLVIRGSLLEGGLNGPPHLEGEGECDGRVANTSDAVRILHAWQKEKVYQSGRILFKAQRERRRTLDIPNPASSRQADTGVGENTERGKDARGGKPISRRRLQRQTVRECSFAGGGKPPESAGPGAPAGKRTCRKGERISLLSMRTCELGERQTPGDR